MKHIFIFFSFLLIASSCSNDDSTETQVSFIEITKVSLSSDKKIPKSNLVIKDVPAWNSLKSKISPNEISEFKETNVDFTKYQIIAVVDQVYVNGGHTIDITKITQNNTTVIIKVENLRTGDATTVITQPYHIIKIAKTDKTIVFK
jgi:hypothetical protein